MNVVNTINPNQWRNTTIVIDWFKSLPQKDKSRFLKFDMVEFYQFYFFTHPDVLSKMRDFLECLIILTNESLMVVIELASVAKRLSSSSIIDG